MLKSEDIGPNIRAKDGYTPLHTASAKGDVSTIKKLLMHPKIKINIKTEDGKTTLDLAFDKGDNATVEELLKHHNIENNYIISAWSWIYSRLQY